MEDTLVLLEQACIDGVLHQYVLEIVDGIGAISLFVYEFRLNKLIQLRLQESASQSSPRETSSAVKLRPITEPTCATSLTAIPRLSSRPVK